MVQSNMTFDPASFKGNGVVNGIPVFVHQFPLTKGGIIDEDETNGAKFGCVVSVDALDINTFKVGQPASTTPVGVLIADPSIMRNDPTMNDYYFAGRPATVMTFGLFQCMDYEVDEDVEELIDPVMGCKVVFNETTGKIGFIASTEAAAPDGYALLNATVYDVAGPNTVTLFLNYPTAA